MANTKVISDEQLIAAIISNGTIKAAAAAVGVSERSVYNRMNNGEFIALYKSAKVDLIRGAVINLNNHIQSAVDTIADIMNDKSNNAAVRLQAAQTILNNAGKFAQRLSAEEQGVTQQIDNNMFLL